ncbi:MAG: LpxI family protein [Magnetovibrionaceae bacterium]
MMQPKLGILAGQGSLPEDLIAACRSDNRPFFVLAFKGQTPESLVADAVPHAWVRLGALGRAIQLLKEAGVEEVVMAGGMQRPSFATLMPDAEGARFLASGAFMKGDDGLLTALIDYIEQQAGFRVVGPDSLLPAQLAEPGVWGQIQPSRSACEDIAKAARVVSILGEEDVGQGAVCQQGLILAVEAIEGTAAMIERSAGLKREGEGPVLVKRAKPGQESRVDRPAIGPDTVKQAAEAGFSGIAVGTGEAMVMSKGDLVALADREGLFVCGFDPESHDVP